MRRQLLFRFNYVEVFYPIPRWPDWPIISATGFLLGRQFVSSLKSCAFASWRAMRPLCLKRRKTALFRTEFTPESSEGSSRRQTKIRMRIEQLGETAGQALIATMRSSHFFLEDCTMTVARSQSFRNRISVVFSCCFRVVFPGSANRKMLDRNMLDRNMNQAWPILKITSLRVVLKHWIA